MILGFSDTFGHLNFLSCEQYHYTANYRCQGNGRDGGGGQLCQQSSRQARMKQNHTIPSCWLVSKISAQHGRETQDFTGILQ